MKKKTFKQKAAWVLVLAVLGTLFPFSGSLNEAQAAASQTATFRIISTTDLHGQVTTMHYDTASVKDGSLAQAYTLIEEAREEVGKANTMSVDIGDSIYGYAADYLLEQEGDDAIQPIYKAMAQVGYDAITLGNHDFDYGYPYLEEQLEMSGLKKKCIVSNVISTDTGEPVWETSRIITKKLKTNKDKTVKVKIGLLGVTIPSLSTYSNVKEDLAGQPVVACVEKGAAALKEQGADLVVVMAHSSFGSEMPSETSDNVVYALTELENVDAIAAGHGHHNFPSSDKDAAFVYKLSGVEKSSGLINGKPVTMVKDHGAGIGLIDLKLKIAADGSIKVSKATTGLRMVTKDTASSEKIVAAEQETVQAVDEGLMEMVGEVASDAKINSYFALLEDNYAIQMVNESKIQYGLAYTGGKGKASYADYPVIAATNYNLYGNQSAVDNIVLDGKVTMKDILNMQQDNHNNNIIYWINGKQLKEWLEWSASIYTADSANFTSDQMLARLMQERGASSIVAGDWVNDWNGFYVFDGIEYTIDATRAPRYAKNGNLVNADTNRIVSLTYNGQEITDSQEFILVSPTLSSSTQANGAVAGQKLVGKADYAYKYLIQFVKEQTEFGPITDEADHNWEVTFDSQKDYIVRSSVLAKDDAAMKAWYQQLLVNNETFAYYLSKFQEETAEVRQDKNVPLLVLAQTVTDATSAGVDVKVQASDRSGISQLKWAAGQLTVNSAEWSFAPQVRDGKFTVNANGVYTVLAVDNNGNRIVRHIHVTNLDSSIVVAPTINKVSNKMAVLTGTAQFGTTVHIQAGENTYEVAAKSDDTFQCKVARMNTGTLISLYCTDSAGRTSRTVTTTVFKNGPNLPIVNEMSNKDTKVTGSYTDSTKAIVAFSGSEVYVSGEEGENLYKKSELYDESYTIVRAEYIQNDKDFEFMLPPQDAKRTVKFVALDQTARYSASVNLVVADDGPNAPKVEQVCDVENYLYGSVSNVLWQGSVTVTVGDTSYTADLAEDNTFAIHTMGFAGESVIRIVANDVKNGSVRSSAEIEVPVTSYTDYLETGMLQAEPINPDNPVLKGYCDSYDTLYLLWQGESIVLDIDYMGNFRYVFNEPVEPDDELYLVTRNDTGQLTGSLAVPIEAQKQQFIQPDGEVTDET